jgi:hypothetical protein
MHPVIRDHSYRLITNISIGSKHQFLNFHNVFSALQCFDRLLYSVVWCREASTDRLKTKTKTKLKWKKSFASLAKPVDF